MEARAAKRPKVKGSPAEVNIHWKAKHEKLKAATVKAEGELKAKLEAELKAKLEAEWKAKLEQSEAATAKAVAKATEAEWKAKIAKAEAENAEWMAKIAKAEAKNAELKAKIAQLDAAEATFTRQSLKALLEYDEDSIKLRLTGSASSHIHGNHIPAEAAETTIQLRQIDSNAESLHCYGSLTACCLFDAFTNQNEAFNNSSEADIAALVQMMVKDAIAILSHLGTIKASAKLSIRRERSLFSEKRDILVVRSITDNLPLLIIAVKNPVKDNSLANLGKLLGQVLDCEQSMRACGNTFTSVILTSVEESFVCWNEKEVNTTAMYKGSIQDDIKKGSTGTTVSTEMCASNVDMKGCATATPYNEDVQASTGLHTSHIQDDRKPPAREKTPGPSPTSTPTSEVNQLPLHSTDICASNTQTCIQGNSSAKPYLLNQDAGKESSSAGARHVVNDQDAATGLDISNIQDGDCKAPARKTAQDPSPTSQSPPTLETQPPCNIVVQESQGCFYPELKRNMARSQVFKAHQLVPLLCTAITHAIEMSTNHSKMSIPCLVQGHRLNLDPVLRMAVANQGQKYHWGSMNVKIGDDKIRISSRYPQRRCTLDDSYYLIKIIGYGSTSNVWQALNSNGNEVVIKMYVKCSDDYGNPLSKKEFDNKAQSAVETEVNNLHTFYLFLDDSNVYAKKLNGFHCVIMPFFKPVAKDKREEKLEEIKKLLKSFYKSELVYRCDDARWRHVGTYKHDESEKVVLYDLADLKKRDLANLNEASPNQNENDVVQKHYLEFVERMKEEADKNNIL